MSYVSEQDLVSLHGRLWKLSKPDRFGTQWPLSQRVSLTQEDWAEIQQTAAALGLVWMPSCGPFGLGFSISLYKPAEHPVYPGTESAFQPEHLVTLADDHLPVESKDFWALVVEPLVLSEGNLARHKKSGLGKIHPRSYYEY